MIILALICIYLTLTTITSTDQIIITSGFFGGFFRKFISLLKIAILCPWAKGRNFFSNLFKYVKPYPWTKYSLPVIKKEFYLLNNVIEFNFEFRFRCRAVDWAWVIIPQQIYFRN